jgi:hypothetical protein
MSGQTRYGHSPQTEPRRTAPEASIRINEALVGWAGRARRPAASPEGAR